MNEKKYNSTQYTNRFNYNRAKWSTQNDKEYIKESYERLVWVYACVSKISSCVSNVNWKLYRRQLNGKKKEIQEHPLLNLVNVNASSNLSSTDFFDLWATYLALNGKFFALYNFPKIPTELYYLYPFCTKPIPSEHDFVSGFEYQYDANKKTYKKEDILWDKFNDPLDAYEGMSPIRAMARTIDTENESMDWNKATLQNAGVPPGAFQIENAGPQIRETLRRDWLERYAGNKNARIPLLLDSSKASYVNFGLSPIDMDFLEQRKLNRLEICTAFEVPGQVAGDPEGQTYANFESALKSFWENTILPKYLYKIQNKLNSDLVARYADNLILEADLNGISALNDSQEALFARAIDIFESGMVTKNEARAIAKLDDVKDDSGDKYHYDLVKKSTMKDDIEEEEETEEVEEDSKKSKSLKKKDYFL